MREYLDLEVIDNWVSEAERLGFWKIRCDEYAPKIMANYCAGSRQEIAPFAKFIAHFIWKKGHKKLAPWEVYAIWSTLEAEEDRIIALVNEAAQEGYAAAWQEAYNHGLEEGYANGFYDGEHSERE